MECKLTDEITTTIDGLEITVSVEQLLRVKQLLEAFVNERGLTSEFLEFVIAAD